tara:strand:- start:564 stop:1223 length:660 start_codon:yes stop_codon:yes gene_type:complete
MSKAETENNELNLNEFFNNIAKNPFTYDLNLGDDASMTHDKLFEKVKNIFVQGLLYVTDEKYILVDGEKKSVMIDKIPKKDIEAVNTYMLSLGIEVVHNEYTEEDKDYQIRRLLYCLQNKLKEHVKIDVTMDWMKQLIHKTQITCDKSKITELNSIIRCYPEANYILKLYAPEKVEDCHMYYNKPDQPGVLNIISFKKANIADYQYQHKYATIDTKHVR